MKQHQTIAMMVASAAQVLTWLLLNATLSDPSFAEYIIGCLALVGAGFIAYQAVLRSGKVRDASQ